MKIKKHLLKLAKARKKQKEKNRNKKVSKDNNLKVYNYKCGQKNIKLTVQKVELTKVPEILSSIFYYNCTFCSKDFDPSVKNKDLLFAADENHAYPEVDSEKVSNSSPGIVKVNTRIPNCPDCNRPLVKINLKKCPQCGAKNNPLKPSCWICNAPFPALEISLEKESRLLLTLNIDGNFYRNTDKVLGLGMKKLFEDLIAAGFSKEPLESWAKIHESDIEYKKESIRRECKRLAKRSRYKIFVYTILAILMILIGVLIAWGFRSG